MVRIAMVGGRFGMAFKFHVHPQSRVTAVCDIDPEVARRMAEDFTSQSADYDELSSTVVNNPADLRGGRAGIKVYTDFDELLRDRDVDAVCIFTPVPLHADMSIKAMGAGKHVMCAVPAALSLDDCARLVETQQSTGMIYMMAETSYYYPEVMELRRLQREGAFFGELFYSQAEYMHDSSEELFLRNPAESRVNLIYDKTGNKTWRFGFPPFLYVTHSSSAVVSVTGERLTEVTALGWGPDSSGFRENAYDNPFTNAVALFKTSGGHGARICEFRQVGAPDRPSVVRFEFYGTEKSYRGAPDHVFGEARVTTNQGASPFRPESPWHLLPSPLLKNVGGHKGSHPFLTHAFVDAVAAGRQPEIDVYEAVAFTAPGICAHESCMKGGAWVSIPDFGSRNDR